jgi:LuxR family quorum sensing-dependent transcriptional regulator
MSAAQKIQQDFGCPFNDREIEVIKWAAEGKTAGETGLIMGISQDIVRTVTQRAGYKINAYNKVNLVAQSLRNGWIS